MKIEEEYVATRSELINRLTTEQNSYETKIKLVRTDSQDPHDRFWQSYLRGNVLQHPSVAGRKAVIADLFSSAGGLSYGIEMGLRSLGFSVKHGFAVDLDTDALEIFQKNFSPTEVFNMSASDTVDFYVHGEAEHATFSTPPTVNHPDLEKYVGRITVLCGGPPCQGHSNLNNRTRRDDVRNLLYLTMPALAVALKCPVVVIENVPSVVHDSWGVVAETKGLLANSGYKVFDGKLLLTKYGGFQTRDRYFLVGIKNPEHGTPLVDFLTGLQRPARPASLPLSDLLGQSTQGLWGNDLFDSVGTMSAENAERIQHLFDNDLYDLPCSERPDCHKDGTSYKSVYGRMKWDEPAPTMTTGFVTPGRGRFIHPLEPRVLTPHEAARIQSFPDSFRFDLSESSRLSKSSLTKWIGDAVPPHMGRLVGLFVASHLQNI
jgi:DNA (cytosine-5)-methyltransferase 1